MLVISGILYRVQHALEHRGRDRYPQLAKDRDCNAYRLCNGKYGSRQTIQHFQRMLDVNCTKIDAKRRIAVISAQNRCIGAISLRR